MLVPLKNKILFVFLNDVAANKQNMFVDQTNWGFHLGVGHESSATQGRWGKVVATGPKTLDVTPGDYIFVENLMWTAGFKHDGINIWQTAEEKVMCVSEELPEL